MITLKSSHEIDLMRRSGKITAAARALAGEMVKPGVTTQEINDAVERFIRKQGAVPSFLHYNGYPASVCISVNDEIIHGIPGKRVLREGDIVSVDVGAYIGGFHGDCAATFPCGTVSPEAQRLIDVTRQSFFEGIRFAREGQRLQDTSAAVQSYVEQNGFSVVREYVGHGVGAKMHESPEIPNYGRPGHGPRLLRGMTLAIEPMVNAGAAAIQQLSDGWTVKTADGKWAAHYENTILITDGAPEILTAPAIRQTGERERMEIAKSNIVRSNAGRDKGKLFAVLAVEGEYLLLADGKSRKVESPKRKKRRHVLFVSAEETRLAEKIKSEEKITNSELRRTLAACREAIQPDQEG